MPGKHSTLMFHDPEMDRQIVNDGFVVLPFLSPEECAEFKALYKKWHPTDPDAFYKSYFDPRIEYKQEVENKITRLFEEKMNHIFTNYDAFGGLFVVKPPTEEGHLPPHQDWSFVDETKHWSINMWCPIDDVNEEFGNIVVLKGSHRFLETVRGSNTPDVYRDHWKLIEQNMISIPMKAGEAIFFFHGLLHGSTHNNTDQTRVSLGLTLTPKDVPLYFYFMKDREDKSQLERFVTDPDFYIHYASHREVRPDMSGEKYPFAFPKLTEEELYEKIQQEMGDASIPPREPEPVAEGEAHEGWWSRLKKSFAGDG